MNIKVDKTKIKDFDVEIYKEKCNEALDSIWEEAWLTRSVTQADKPIIADIEKTAESIRKHRKKVVIVTSGEIGKLIKAVKSILTEDEDDIQIDLIGDSVSPSDYVKVLNKINDEEFVLLAITGKDDTLAVRSAYATMKQLLVSEVGVEKAADDNYVVASDKNNYITRDAMQSHCKVIYYPEDTSELYCAGAEPVLLLLAVMGYDAEKYLDGFRDMLSSPEWDDDATDYSIAKAMAYKNGYEGNIIYMQRQLEDFASWMEEAECIDSSRTVILPDEKQKNKGKKFSTYITIEKDDNDIMMPYFEGAQGEGSLNLLMNEAGNKYFFEETKEFPGVKLSIEWLESYNLGQFFAFIQLSNLITEFLYNN